MSSGIGIPGSYEDGPVFNPSFIGLLVICGAVSVFFLLYFNRLFATVISWGIRAWTWHQYRVYIDIQALQISLLGGRVFFTGLRYHGNNETILVQNGHITWSYWLRRVKEVDISKRPKGEKIDPQEEARKAKLPCRINVSLLGLEWFIYNRSPAYDSIFTNLMEDATKKTESVAPGGEEAPENPTKLRRRRSKRFTASDNIHSGRPSEQTEQSEATTGRKNTGEMGQGHRRNESTQSSGTENGGEDGFGSGDDDVPLLLQLFPIHLECEKAALVMGNENTKAILIVKADSLNGEIDASNTPAPDPYRQIFHLNFIHPVVEMKENHDFKEEQADRAMRERRIAEQTDPVPRKSFFRRQRKKILGQLRNLVPYWRTSVESLSLDSKRGTAGTHVPGVNHWQGLSRYLGDDRDDQKARWAAVEYAAVPTVMDSPEATLIIYWDVVGRVRPRPGGKEKSPHTVENINGDEPPAWAINLAIKGGSINYGPWADRQRADLQRVFVPSLCKDATPAERLSVGDYRVPTQFKLLVELDDEVSVRIPVREESKNWRWKGNEPGQAQPQDRQPRNRSKKVEQTSTVHQRPYGWLDIKVAANASISYSMDMTANASGFSNTLKLDLPGTEISSSINHELLWRSGRQRISCDLSNPLRWNSLRQWHFDVISDELELFLLRDHVFLLIDLVDDWATGPPAEYLTFTPFKYHLNLQLQNLKLYLNVNDKNIIDNPTDLEDNSYIVIASPLLRSKTCISLDTFRPSKNAIPFDVRADTALVSLHVPDWNTQASFLTTNEIGHLENLVVDGSYHYNATTSPANTDTLVLNVGVQSPVARLHGFVIRYCLKIKDNYFGEDLHFKTLEEYQDALRLKESNPEAEAANVPPPKKSNDMDVILAVRIDDPKAFLPANLYSSNRNVQMDTAALSVDLRFTNYYMDLELAIAPLNLSVGSADEGVETPISATSSTQLFIDGINIYGSRLFGLPPTEPTYMCNWDINVGAVAGECSVGFLNALANGGKAFGFSFDDDENALVTFSSIVFYDVTFLRAFVQSVCIWVHIEEAAFQLSTGTIEATYNDWARSHYSKRANVKVPDIQVSCINTESATRSSKSRSLLHQPAPVETNALIQTTLHMAIISRKFDFSQERRLQQELIRREDQRTQRTPFLLLHGLLDDLVPDAVDPPAQSVPPIPQPTTEEDIEGIDDGTSLVSSRGTSRYTPALHRHNSFLSFSSSSQSSLLKPSSSRRSSVKKRHGRSDLLRPLTTMDQQPPMHPREPSSSTRHPAFNSAHGDSFEQRQGVFHNTVAFSSQYFAPYFPLENVQPNTRETAMPSVEQGDGNDDDGASTTLGFNLEDIDPDILSQDSAYSSTLVELPSGLSIYCDPTALRYVASLLSSLQPSDPEDVLDSLQLGSMGDIFDMQKEQKMKGRVSDLLVRLPRANVRFVNSSELDSADPPQDEQDQYDISIGTLALATRAEHKWDDAFKLDTRTSRNSFHARLSSLELSAAERLSDMQNTQAAVLVQVDNVMASMGSKDITYLDVDVGNIQGSTSSEKIEYLAALIHRTTVLASDLGDVFEGTSSREENLKKFLAYRLTTDGGGVPDPTFLVRPSAVLRSAEEHLRTFDSWKLITRFRQMWAMMGAREQEQLKLDCLGQFEFPADARQQVITALQRWRSWDLENLSESTLLSRIFGAPHKTPKASDEKPFLAVVRMNKAQLVLDPGPKQNEISFFDLTARMESKTPAKESPEGSAETIVEPIPMTMVNVYCSNAAINVNWELCELADDILRLVKRMQSKPGALPSPKPDHPSPPMPKKQSRVIHCVLAINQGSSTFDAINLHASSYGSDMKASLLLKTDPGDLAETHFVFSCDTVASKLRSHSQPLTKFVLHKPSVIIAHELQTTETTDSHTVKASASSKNLVLTVRQDPVVLTELLDLIVRDELAQIVKLKDQLPSSPKPSTPNKKIVDRLSAFRVNVAMFMDQYTITAPLLRSLTYSIHGTVARAAMAANFGKEIIFDFDIKENSHEMQVDVKNVPRSISILQIPPTNGRVTSHMGNGEHLVTISASLELVQLDASAVYSLLTALNRPEITNSINDLQQQVKVIQEHAADLFGTSEATPVATTKDEDESDTLVYAAHLTFAGLEVFGTSPLQSETAPNARISFCLDSIHLEGRNRVEAHGPVLAYPEFHANLRLIDFEIQKGTEQSMNSCGNVTFGALVTATSKLSETGKEKRFFNVRSDSFEVNLSPETVSTVVDVLGYMGDKIKDLDTSRELEYLRKLRQTKPRIAINDEEEVEEADIMDAFFSSVTWTFEVCDIRIAWLVTKPDEEPVFGKEDLVLSLQRIEFGTRTRNSARLTIENLQLEIVNALLERKSRAPNSALLPEIIFNVAYVSTADARRLAFQAVGKSLDIRLTSGFIIPASNLNDSIGLSLKNVQQASQNWTPARPATPQKSTPVTPQKADEPRRNVFGSKRIESFLVDADFAGAVVYLTGKRAPEDLVSSSKVSRAGLPGKYGQFSQDDPVSSTVLRSPGLAWKMEYRDDGVEDPSLFAEIRVDASSNILYPSVVPLVLDISNSIKEVVSSRDNNNNNNNKETPVQPKLLEKPKGPEEENILTADPSAVLGRMKLNLGLRIYKQEFSLSCQPIARVAATASFEDVYFTVNTVRSVEQGNFFAISGAFTNLQASVQHVYSRESTGSFEVESMVLSLMNSKHVSGTSGVSAILKVSPMKVSVNAKQLQDFLLFREIWMPQDVRQDTSAPVAKLMTETSQGHLVQRYQQVAATAAFPWTATISISALEINVDLGQALGKSVFAINNFWISSKKTSDWEQNLCLGFDRIGVDSTGRMSGFVALQDFKLRTSIQWPEREAALNETPLIQASVGFSQFRVKAAFDYQAFLVADITSMAFLMYNVRSHEGSGDRLVAIFDGDAVQIFGTTTSAAQGIAMYQAFLRLVQERRANFEMSLREIEKFMKRKSVSAPAIIQRLSIEKPATDADLVKSPISLDTDVVVTLKALNLGLFPSTFSDHQVFKMEALNAQARFAASMEDDHRIHSILGLTLGQLRIGLAGVREPRAPKTLGELSVEDVAASATGSRGGTILKVPRVEAIMQTWQRPQSRHIDYIFKSAFEGKVEVGWNYSRISYIRGMWANHSKSLSQAWGRELPNVTAIRVTGVPEAAGEAQGPGGETKHDGTGTGGKITAEVKVPQSKYDYTALEPPVIETPQLRDMGEATPPLEWIGLNRDRLPNLTHQIVIVSLLELAGEVEDAYSRILGSS